jgi:hypothetical protein
VASRSRSKVPDLPHCRRSDEALAHMLESVPEGGIGGPTLGGSVLKRRTPDMQMLRREVGAWDRQCSELARAWSNAVGQSMHTSNSRGTTVHRTLDRALGAGLSLGHASRRDLCAHFPNSALWIPSPRRLIADSSAIHRIMLSWSS